MRTFRNAALSAVMLIVCGLALNVPAGAGDHKLPERMHMTSVFSGKVVNGGTAMHSQEGKKHMLTWSEDFQIPGSPAPHWQVVDSKGNVYLLNRLKIKEDKINRTIVLPSYVKDVAKVQIWCAWAEVLLGEATFREPIQTR